MSGRRAALRFAAVLAGLVHVAGCRSGPAEATFLERLESLTPAAASVSGQALYPLTAGRVDLLYEDDAGGIETIERVGTETTRYGAEIEWAIPPRTEYWAAGADGAVVMPASVEHGEQALTRFDPPLRIAPAALPPGEPFEHEVRMVVLDEKNPRRQRESGTARRTITYVDDQRIRTPLGDFTARRVVAEFKADLRFADATETTTYWIVDDIGVVASERVNEVRVLGLAGSKTTERFVRRSR